MNKRMTMFAKKILTVSGKLLEKAVAKVIKYSVELLLTVAVLELIGQLIHGGVVIIISATSFLILLVVFCCNLKKGMRKKKYN